MDGRSQTGSADPRYKYTGKERDAETGEDWFEVRGYDCRIGRFLSIDPHASSYAWSSPYSYAVNNPIAVIDPTGMDSTSQANVVVLAAPAASTALGQFLKATVADLTTVSSAVVTAVVWMATTLDGAPTPQAETDFQARQEATSTDEAQPGDQSQTKSESEKGQKTESETKESNKSGDGLKKRIAEHQQKLESYKNNPEASDNKGLLKNAPSKEVRDRIVNGRIRKLEKEIRAFEKALQKLSGKK
jgi:RHS repeat-associated protein